jgi:hypothetical protein
MVKVMIWYHVSDFHEVITTLILVMFNFVLLKLTPWVPSDFFVMELALLSHDLHFDGWSEVHFFVGWYAAQIHCKMWRRLSHYHMQIGSCFTNQIMICRSKPVPAGLLGFSLVFHGFPLSVQGQYNLLWLNLVHNWVLHLWHLVLRLPGLGIYRIVHRRHNWCWWEKRSCANICHLVNW